MVESLQWRSVDPLLRCMKCSSDLFGGSIVRWFSRKGFFQFLAEMDFSENCTVGLTCIKNSSNK